MAAYAATRIRPDGLILESGFPDARALVRSSPPLAVLALFSTYRFKTSEYVDRARVRLLVMHGDADSVVPFALGRTLAERAPGPKSSRPSLNQVHSPARITGSVAPPGSTPSMSSSRDPIMKSTCAALRLPPMRSNSSSLRCSPRS